MLGLGFSYLLVRNSPTDECLKHSDYTRVSIAFSCCLGIIYIVLGIISLI